MKLETDEVLNYLLAYEHLQIIQHKDMFNFSLDTVLLAHFCSITKDVRTIIDLGTNNAAIPLLLSTRTNKPVIGVEIQKKACEIAKKNVVLNHLEKQITIVHADMKDYVQAHPKSSNLVLCNPPFFKLGEKSNLNESEYLTIARHEMMVTLKEIVATARGLLEYHGRFAMVHRPDRLIEIIEAMKENDIEPKRLRFVYPKVGKDSHILLIEGIYKGQPGLKIEPPLYAHNQDGSYSDEVRKMFGEDLDAETEKL